ncbi:MAG: hypothetical protein JWO52_5302 [Gammaproteobacteria bacterium]|nr:hypothetical protein [Gammaproteobacteria bacterium]
MKIAQFGRFIDHFTFLANVGSGFREAFEARRGTILEQMSRDIALKRAKAFRDGIEPLNVPISLRRVNEFIELLEPVTPGSDGKFVLEGQRLVSLIASMDQLANSFGAELEAKKFLMIGADQSKYFEEVPIAVWGQDFANKFPSTLTELNEAAKCLALSRSTAAVFHLMRLTEVGLEAIHHCLGITTVLVGNDRNWGNILRGIKTNIDGRGNTWSERSLFEEFYFLLDSVKSARNNTMHLDAVYTEERAEIIFAATRGFMTRIASRLDENGDQKA